MLSRRHFLASTAAAASVAVAAPLSLDLPTGLPTLYGDGIRDDAPAINAILRGDRAIAAADGAIVEGRTFFGTLHRLASPLVIERDDVTIAGGRYVLEADVRHFVRVQNVRNVTIRHTHCTHAVLHTRAGASLENARDSLYRATWIKRAAEADFGQALLPALPTPTLAARLMASTVPAAAVPIAA
jgi:hypothetical protein